MVGPIILFFGDNELETYKNAKENNLLEANTIFKNLSSDTKEGIDLYIKNYDGYDLNNSIRELIKNDFLKIKSRMNKLETKLFLKDAYYIRTNITDIATMNIYGSSVYNPMFNINFLEASLIIKFHDNNVLGNLGISYDKFKTLTKSEQNTIIDILKNINQHKTQDVGDVLNELNKENEV